MNEIQPWEEFSTGFELANVSYMRQHINEPGRKCGTFLSMKGQNLKMLWYKDAKNEV